MGFTHLRQRGDELARTERAKASDRGGGRLRVSNRRATSDPDRREPIDCRLARPLWKDNMEMLAFDAQALRTTEYSTAYTDSCSTTAEIVYTPRQLRSSTYALSASVL